MSETMRERRARLRAAAVDDPTVIAHGTVSGYDLYGCRCDSCRATHTSRVMEWRTTPRGRESASRDVARQNRRKQERSTPTRNRNRWTGPELELLAGRGETTLEVVAQRLGRSFFATVKAAERLQRDPGALARGGFTTGSTRG